jgi:hypothetical protein
LNTKPALHQINELSGVSKKIPSFRLPTSNEHLIKLEIILLY